MIHVPSGPLSQRCRPFAENLAPAPFLPVQALPISYTSPFEDANSRNAVSPQLANASQYTVHWVCGDTQLSADAYHSLRLNVDNGQCQNETSNLGVYVCGGTVIDQATYAAVSTGESDLCTRIATQHQPQSRPPCLKHKHRCIAKRHDNEEACQQHIATSTS